MNRIGFYTLIRRIKYLFKYIFQGITLKDDFDWDMYHLHYQGELSEIAKTNTQILNRNDYIFKNGELVINRKILPLHPNHRLLYETILQLSPSSVIELGSGGGDHLHNIKNLSPYITLHGIDVSPKQINLLHKRHPRLKAEIEQLDITLPQPLDSPKFDVSFTQAVIMHIHTGNGHLVALSNLFRFATRQVILMENWQKHNFMEDIKFLFSKNILPWKKLHIYYRESKELKKPHIMIVSCQPLKDYKELTDYSILRNGRE